MAWLLFLPQFSFSLKFKKKNKKPGLFYPMCFRVTLPKSLVPPLQPQVFSPAVVGERQNTLSTPSAARTAFLSDTKSTVTLWLLKRGIQGKALQCKGPSQHGSTLTQSKAAYCICTLWSLNPTLSLQGSQPRSC